jgi:hypothetical protein
MGILDTLFRPLGNVNKERSKQIRENFKLVLLANVIQKTASIFLKYPVRGQYILSAGVGLDQDPNNDVVEGRFLVVPAPALKPVVQFFGQLSESRPTQMIAIAESTGRQCLTAADLACGLAEVYNGILTDGLYQYQQQNRDSFGAITLKLSREKSPFAYLIEVGGAVIPSITPLPLSTAEYFCEIQPLLSQNDRLEIALGVDGVANQLNIGDLLFPYERADLDTCVVTVFPQNSRFAPNSR